MRQILVAVDDSEASQRVGEFVNRFFGELDVSITAVNVGTVPLAWGPYPAAPGVIYPWAYAPVVPPVDPGTGSTLADTARDAAEQTVQSSGVRASDHVIELEGDVADTIRRVAEERDVDLLVVGSTHKGLFERLLSPSVSADLAKSAPRPVLIVH